MSKLLFMRPLLDLLSRGKDCRKIAAFFLRALAALIAISAIVSLFLNWDDIFKPRQSMAFGQFEAASVTGERSLTGPIVLLVFMLILYLVIHALLIRAGDIRRLPESEFTFIPLMAIGLKLIGEVYAGIALVASVAGGLLVWITREPYGLRTMRKLFDFTPFTPGYGSGLIGGGGFFVAGLNLILGGVIAAFLALLLFHYLAESLMAITKIVENTKAASDSLARLPREALAWRSATTSSDSSGASPDAGGAA
jgi:hypothetical protein